jgi:hypothetical protein
VSTCRSHDECECCGSREGVRWEDSRTMYHHEPGEPDPNAPLLLCRDCAEEHHAMWDERWQEYYASRM